MRGNIEKILIIIFLFTANWTVAQRSRIPVIDKGKIKSYLNSAENFEKEGKLKESANNYNKTAYIYWQYNHGREAINYFKKSLDINSELDNTHAIKELNTNIGQIYFDLGDFHSALHYFNQSLLANRTEKKNVLIASDLFNIALVYSEIKQYHESNIRLDEAVQLSTEINDLQLLKSCYNLLAENYDKLGDSRKSMENYTLYASLQKHFQEKALEHLESRKKQAEEIAYKTEKRLRIAEDTLVNVLEDYKDIRLKKELAEKENEFKDMALKDERERLKAIKRAHFFRTIFYASFLTLVSIISLLIFFQFRQNKKSNKLLKIQNNEIEKQRDEANRQKQKLTDSIFYAQRIQNAILPPKSTLDDILSEYFVFYKPRDIVSGDFYWLTQKENILVLAVADCTGHGVPGAFMSMLGIAFLNEIVNKIVVNRHIKSLQADDVLNELRENIVASLHQTGNRDEPKDGMDIAICIIDFDDKTLQYTGARNPIYIIREGELNCIRGDKMSVSYSSNYRPFTKHDIDLKKGDIIYLFSDGYLDQFGGEKRMKFLPHNFQKLLLSIHKKTMEEQKQLLIENFNTWKGENNQLDDVLVLGYKFEGKKSIKVGKDKYQWQNKKILIAEDTDINYFLLVEALRPTNIQLVRVKNGEEAVEFCKSNEVDLILMDINMPVMNGYEATKSIKSFHQDIPIIVQTAMNYEDEEDKSYDSGADDYIAKPIDLKTFLTKLEKYLD